MGTGFYYLHENGDLIWKRFQPEMDAGGFVKRVWSVDITDRATAWILLIEALAVGVSVPRVAELANRWGCDGRDLVEFMARDPQITEERRKGLELFLEHVLNVDSCKWFDWLRKTPTGEAPDFESMPTMT